MIRDHLMDKKGCHMYEMNVKILCFWTLLKLWFDANSFVMLVYRSIFWLFSNELFPWICMFKQGTGELEWPILIFCDKGNFICSCNDGEVGFSEDTNPKAEWFKDVVSSEWQNLIDYLGVVIWKCFPLYCVTRPPVADLG